MAYEVTALVTFWVDATNQQAASTMVENLEEEVVADKIEVVAVQVNRADTVTRRGSTNASR